MSKQPFYRVAGITLLFMAPAFSGTVWAHGINYEMEKAPAGSVVWYYLQLGFMHIIPEGFDHILFVAGLCFLNSKMKMIIWQATAFTVAHSVTLALSMKSIITLPPEIVEPIIALSILFIALENILLKELKPSRVLVVFVFGLIHGLGFASALNEIGLPRNQFATSILSFNLGVELGQIAVILSIFLLLLLPFRDKPWYRQRVVIPMSVLIALTAGYWSIARIMN